MGRGRRGGGGWAPCHNTPIGNPTTRASEAGAKAGGRRRRRRREIFMAVAFVRLLLEAVSLIPKRAPDTRETKKDADRGGGREREREREAPYCRGAC